MVKARRIIYDVKTGELKEEEFEYEPIPAPPPLPGIDIEKLKDVLLEKGIISDKSEVE